MSSEAHALQPCFALEIESYFDPVTMAFYVLIFFKFGVDKGSIGHKASPSFYPYGEMLTVN